jgi:predicted RNA-binding protein YlxR (DUF448 family)
MPHSGHSSPAKAKRSRSGPRPKHVPHRTCVVCREQDAKRTLTRIVRTPEGSIEVDPSGRKNGRGAYLCDKQACWERATSTPVLARALKAEMTPEVMTSLKEYAAGLHLSAGDDEPTVDSKEPAS